MSRGLKPKREKAQRLRKHSFRRSILPSNSIDYQSRVIAILLEVRICPEGLATKKLGYFDKGYESQRDKKTRPGDSLIDGINKRMVSLSLEDQGKVEQTGDMEELEASVMDTIYDADEEDNVDDEE